MHLQYDVVVVGGGLVGLATGLALTESGRVSVILLEAEERLATHQSSHNSGVIHSGLYYQPDTLKARMCREGRDALYQFCADEGIPHRRDGKLVVATRPAELAALAQLEGRGRANGLTGVRQLGREELRELEPEVTGLAALWVPETAAVDFAHVAVAFTRTIDGRVDAGPNAVLALKREGYARTDVSARDVAEMVSFVGFWRMAARHWRIGLTELTRSLSKQAFVRALQRLVPNLRAGDVVPAGSGVRAQAVDRSGQLIGDFRIAEGKRSLHLLNAPSPAATACLSIGTYIAG